MKKHTMFFLFFYFFINMISITLWGQIGTPDMVAKAFFYEALDHRIRGSSIGPGENIIYFDRKADGQFQGNYTAYLPAKPQIWIYVEVYNKEQTLRFPLEKVHIESALQVFAVNQQEFIIYHDGSNQNTIRLHFSANNQPFTVDFNIIWRQVNLSGKNDPTYDSEKDGLIVLYSNQDSPFIQPGLAVQVAASSLPPDYPLFQDLSPFGNVYALKESGQFKTRVGTFETKLTASRVRDQIVAMDKYRKFGPFVVSQVNMIVKPKNPSAQGPHIARLENAVSSYDGSNFNLSPKGLHIDYYIQVSALMNNPAQGQFENLGSLRIEKTPELYKVWVGSYDTREQAEYVLTRIQKMGYPGAFIIEQVTEIPVMTAKGPATYDLTGETYNYHTILKGQTLFSIAQKYGLSVAELCEMNNLYTNDLIYPGQTLRIRQ